jgi:hypothetical protein
MRFIEKPANKRSIAKRKPLYGIAINDADYVVSSKVNGKRDLCPFFRVWVNMLKRCYCRPCQIKQPTYRGCTVGPEWLTFSNFKAWMQGQEWEGKELDKDILHPGNNVYAPEHCMFVTRAINSLMNPRAPRHASIPTGVWFDLGAGKWRAEVCAYGKKRYLGLYYTSMAAGRAYRKAKAAHIAEVAMQQTQPLQDALLQHSELLQ